MINSPVKKEIRDQVDQLPIEQQRLVLDFARKLANAQPRGVPGRSLLRFAGTIGSDDLLAMKDAIEQGCEQVDRNEW